MKRARKPLDYPNISVRQTARTMRRLIKTQFFVVMISDFPDKKSFWQHFLSVMGRFVQESELASWFMKVEYRYREHCNGLSWIPRDWERILIFAEAMAGTMLECDRVADFYRQRAGSSDLRMTVINDIMPRPSWEFLERVGAIALLCNGFEFARGGRGAPVGSPLPA